MNNNLLPLTSDDVDKCLEELNSSKLTSSIEFEQTVNYFLYIEEKLQASRERLQRKLARQLIEAELKMLIKSHKFSALEKDYLHLLIDLNTN